MDKNTLLIAIVLVGIYVFNRWRKASQGNSPQQLSQALEQGALVIDVREVSEYQSGHYPGALNIPLHQIKQNIHLLPANHSQPIIVYCASGLRSGLARHQIEDAGFTTVLNAGSQRNLPAAKD